MRAVGVGCGLVLEARLRIARHRSGISERLAFPTSCYRPNFKINYRVFGILVFVASAFFPSPAQVLAQTSVTTWHYDNARDGANTTETRLTPSNVNKASFGKLSTKPVDGFLVGQPLYLPGVNISGQGVHNVVYVATMHDSVYAFDADNTSTSPLWMMSILSYSPAGATSVPATVKKDGGTTGWSEVGIVSTPVA